jgi:(1->4)-alpha-D-glucan 1-alpha-D-glucosylmutase
MRIPSTTYRLQFSSSFRFEDAKPLVSYLADLGISDIYASPILKATRGSTHCYDVTAPDELNPELGMQEDFEALAAERRTCDIGWLQDIVPNHMAYSSENHMLMDVFENGPKSRYAHVFDVFRDHPEPELQGKVLAPALGRPLRDALAEGELQLALDKHGLAVRYYDWRFPLSLASYEAVLRHPFERAQQMLAGADRILRQFTELCNVFAAAGREQDTREKRREVQQAKATLHALCQGNDAIRAHLDRALSFYNHVAPDQAEDGALATLLKQQNFKLVFWQRATQEINYRRFFYLNDFIAVRIEDAEVFEIMHERIMALVRAGLITGLRIDHIDGLYHPRAYLRRLRERAPDAYLVAEKILELEESLPTDWTLEGTSGYKFCNYVNEVFCESSNDAALTDLYREFIGAEIDYNTLLFDSKKRIIEEHMGGEVAYLAHLLRKATAGAGTDASVRSALTTLIAAFPVYRTYIDDRHFSEQDQKHLAEAIRIAKQRRPDSRSEIDRIGAVLLSQRDSSDRSRPSESSRHFLMRFQQFTGPAMAKGFEDTVLYTYNRLVSLNEVGGDPSSMGVGLDRFHEFNCTRARNWPHAMNATSTHDTKRGEDVRARLNVLSEIPGRWREAVTRWKQMNETHKRIVGDAPAPDANDEYLLYQTLVGALPFEQDYDRFTDRVKQYMVKAVREAKRHSTWVQPNLAYENACLEFTDSISNRTPDNPFWHDFLEFQHEIGEYGISNSLSQTLLKTTCPGVPDFYQGAELWDLNLVDPDNRRAVDFGRRMRFLREIQEPPAQARGELIAALTASRHDGRIKLFLIQQALHTRNQNKTLFQSGDYIPATVTGKHSRHIVAFFRVGEEKHALVVVPRFPTALVPPGEFAVGRRIWADTRISLPPHTPATWHDVMSARTLAAPDTLFVGDLLSTFPVALLLGATG